MDAVLKNMTAVRQRSVVCDPTSILRVVKLRNIKRIPTAVCRLINQSYYIKISRFQPIT